MLTAKEEALLNALEPRAEREGTEIVTLEIASVRRSPTIRVYIDREGGVSFDELVAAQAWISEIIEKIDPFPGAYDLEVSSPGIDRPLRTPEHFERFSGEKVRIKTASPLDGRSTWTGTLQGFSDGKVLIECDGAVESVPLSAIKKANVIATLDFKG